MAIKSASSLMPLIVCMGMMSTHSAFPQNSRVEWSAFSSGFGSPGSQTGGVNSSVGQVMVGSSQLIDTLIESGFLASPLLHGRLTGAPEPSAEKAPLTFSLSQNYPNPFNPKTVVSYQLPVVSSVSLVVYDVLGREVAVLVNERQEPGVHEVRFDGSSLASGVYFCRLQAGNFVQTKKLLLVR